MGLACSVGSLVPICLEPSRGPEAGMAKHGKRHDEAAENDSQVFVPGVPCSFLFLARSPSSPILRAPKATISSSSLLFSEALLLQTISTQQTIDSPTHRQRSIDDIMAQFHSNEKIMVPLRGVAALFTIVELGLTAYGACHTILSSRPSVYGLTNFISCQYLRWLLHRRRRLRLRHIQIEQQHRQFPPICCAFPCLFLTLSQHRIHG